MALKVMQMASAKVGREHDVQWLVTRLTGLYLTTGISPEPKVTIHLPPCKAVLVIKSDEDLVTSDNDLDVDRKWKHLTDAESEVEEMPRWIKHRK